MSPCARGGEVRAGDPDLASRPEGGVDERIKSGGRLDSARQLGDSCGNSHIVVISIFVSTICDVLDDSGFY